MSRTKKNQTKFQLAPITAIFILFEIIFIVFIIITIRNLSKGEIEVPKMGINNYSVIPEGVIVGKTENGLNFELDEVKKSIIENTLYEEILLNNTNNVGNNDAKIREGSIHNVYISELDVYLLNFIVDVNNLKQSYRVVYRWSDSNPNENIPQNVPAIAFCLDDNELIYEDFDCKDKYSEDTVVYDLLQNKTFHKSVLSLSGDVYNGEPLNIIIYADSDEEFVKEAAVEEISSYLSKVGFDLNHFEYKVTTNFVY